MPLLAMVAARSSRSSDDPREDDITAGIAKLQAAHSQIDTMGFRTQLPYCLASLAEGYLLDRDLAAAQSAAEQAIKATVTQNDAGARIQAQLVLAEIQRLEAGSDQDAGAALRAEALAMAERLSLRPQAARCGRKLAVIA